MTTENKINECKKIVGYKLVVEYPAETEKQVNELLKKGWNLFGYPSFDRNGQTSNHVFTSVSQAMVKYAS
ncbi:MAG: hypothetical protein Edafosvirus8_28 [Edafosvirus sp.]|uniref:DUF1737 domain-containing protein n=1 Tax=Edafosvirus sp. TaxID=2487765 RepID=A0A3G4ZTR2_9VIRU|nr:MAG: hypothetical protein Edafosvirus8_28 [Edafosvirus sp.]